MQDQERPSWKMKEDDYISKSFEKNFFQSSDFHEVLKQIGWKTVFLKFRSSDSEGSILAYTLQNLPLYHRFLPCYRVFYGPCVKAERWDSCLDMLDLLLKKLCEKVERDKGVSLTLSVPLPFPYADEVFLQNGFRRAIVKGEYSVFIDLKKDSKALWKGMKRFARRCVKKALKKGVKIRGIENERELRQFYMLYMSTAARRSFTPFPYSFFLELWTKLEPKGLVKFFMAYLGNKSIGGILNTIYAGESVPYIACSLREFWNFHPNHLLFWHSIAWSKEVANSSIFKLYHLPPTREKVQGVDYYTFKTCFGGQLAEERTVYHKIFSPTKSKILNLLQKSLQNHLVAVSVRAIVKQFSYTSG